MSDTPETDALREAIDSGAAVEAEMTSLAGKLEQERDEAREECAQVCRTLAKMHHAATGSECGPNVGLIEDVAALRRERDEQTAKMCQAIGYLSDIAEACQDWLDSIIQEPSVDFIKGIRDWAKKKSQNQ